MQSKKFLVGIFLVTGVALFAVGLFLIGDRKQVFSKHFEIYTEFANVSELQTGAKIRVSGMDAGEVIGMQVPSRPSAKFRLTLKIDDKVRRLVRLDSVASIQTEGLVGDKYLEIATGSDGAPECPPNGTIPGKEPFDISNLMEQGSGLVKTTQASIEDIRRQADQTLQAFAKTGADADQVVASIRGDVKQIASTAARITDDMNQIVAGIREGQGPVGKLLNDKNLSDRIDRTSENLESASASVNNVLSDFQKRDLLGRAEATLENARQTTAHLNEAVNALLASNNGGQSTVSGLREMVTGARETMSNLADDSEALKHNFFLRGFFKRRGYYSLDLLTPEKYMQSKFVHGKSTVRVWIPAATLFAPAPQGNEQLSPQGRTAIDEAMGRLVKYLPNRPIIIEGYSDAGSEEERYLRSRGRAATVEECLQKEYHLNAKLTGIMPLGDSVPPQTGKTTWDGVSLVLLR
jgi:phospholipid/cholesterol/gamma-HCH transport system substrate-binding protein